MSISGIQNLTLHGCTMHVVGGNQIIGELPALHKFRLVVDLSTSSAGIVGYAYPQGYLARRLFPHQGCRTGNAVPGSTSQEATTSHTNREFPSNFILTFCINPQSFRR